MAITLESFAKRFVRGEDGYSFNAYQYGSTSNPAEETSPRVIIYAQGLADVQKALKYAAQERVRLSVRTGGHQYCAASSTGGDNILLDLSEAFPEFDDTYATNGLVRAGISLTLGDLLAKLTARNLFVPTWQCSRVTLGGHVQTGGWGQCGRSFGLLGDHIEAIDLVGADGKVRKVKHVPAGDDAAAPTEDSELFYAILGGSPGNFGVLTHVYISPHHDTECKRCKCSHAGSIGVKIAAVYTPDATRNVLKIFEAMSDDEDYPRGIDVCLTVMGYSWNPSEYNNVLDPDLSLNRDLLEKFQHPKEFGGTDEMKGWFPGIMLYLQWVNVDGQGSDKDRALADFQRYRDALAPTVFMELYTADPAPMSQIVNRWIFNNIREFNTPYDKREYLTSAHNISARGWSDWIAGRMELMQVAEFMGCHLSAQCQFFGGRNSMFRKNGLTRNTAYSWRDTTMATGLDCFYEPVAAPVFGVVPREVVAVWQRRNDDEFYRRFRSFPEEQRRVLWASYYEPGEPRSMGNVWQYYYTAAQRQRLMDIKAAVDPRGILSANNFRVDAPRLQDIFPPQSPVATVNVLIAIDFFSMILNWILGIFIRTYKSAESAATALHMLWLFNIFSRAVRWVATAVLQLVLKLLGFTNSSTAAAAPPPPDGAAPPPPAPDTNVDAHFATSLLRDIEARSAMRL